MSLNFKHGMSSWRLLLVLAFFVAESATDERSLPMITDEQLLSTNKRFQQIMQGSSASDAGWQPPSKTKTEQIDVKAAIAKLNSTYVYQNSWPDLQVKLGAVTAVSFDKDGNIVIFHRVDRIWSHTTFNNANIYTEQNKGPIRNSTVLGLERESGRLVYDWGKNIFYMPHGLLIDKEDNVWVTDVALHQVFKFGPRGSGDKPLMTLGTAFTPGQGDRFCKPTSVAVLDNGDFFVADGYCNARMLKYSKSGQKILSWGQNSFAGASYKVAPKNFFAIPHALTLVPEKKLVCAADRENGRVQCFTWDLGIFHSQYHSQLIGDRLFSMDYTPAEGGQLMIVNGPTAEWGIKPEQYNEVRGYVVDMNSKEVISKFGPNDLQFSNPHDVAVTADGREIYVAELDPMRIHKFLHKKYAKSLPISAAKPTATNAVESEAQNSFLSDNLASNANTTDSDDHVHKGHVRPGATAILVATLMVLFAFLTFAMALLIARRRKRGCLPFGVQNRRHAWDFPAKPEGFKLGGLLMDRSKRSGFEKLDQDASDEEREATTNMLTSAPYA